MGKRLIISESEKNDIRSRYGLISEDIMGSTCTNTLTNLIKQHSNYGLPKVSALEVTNVKGAPKVNGMAVKRGTSISLNEKITMNNGEEITFKDVNHWGLGSVKCDNNRMDFLLIWE
jgi:hypothetical protein